MLIFALGVARMDQSMPIRAKLFVAITAAAGAAAIGTACMHWDSSDPLKFGCYLVIALFASTMKVKLPGMDSTMSVHFLFVLLGVLELSLAETLVIACMAALIQSVWKNRQRSEAIKVLFNVLSNTATATWLTYYAYQLSTGFLRHSMPLLLLVAACTFFLSNTIPVAIVIALAERRPLRGMWSETYFWTLPYYLAGAALVGVVSFCNRYIGWQSALLIVPVMYVIYRSYHLYLDRLDEQKKRVEIEELQVVAEKLHVEEFEKMKIHPAVGADILERVAFPYPVAPIVRAHHEKWDGTGYPDGLKGEEIPIGARILAAVDCLDAVASDRQYRKALPLDEAMKLVVEESGKSYDPRVVEVLARRYRELEAAAVLSLEAAGKDKHSFSYNVERGEKPAAGFEVNHQHRLHGQTDFLSSIASARQEAHTLFELSQDLGNSLSLDETLSLVAIRLRKLVPYDSVVVFVKKGDVLEPEFVSGDNFRFLSSLVIPVGTGLCGWVAQNSRPIVNGNPEVDPGFVHERI